MDNTVAPRMTFQDVLRAIEEQYPDLWRVCYPRLYRDTGRYGSPKIIPAAIAVSVQWVADDIRNAPASTKNIYLAACKAREFDFPTLFVAPELLAAVAETDPPADLLWQEIELPFEASALVLPRGALRHHGGGFCEAIGWARIRAGEMLQFGKERQPVKLQEDVFIVFTGLTQDEGFPLLDAVLNASTLPRVSDSPTQGTHTTPAREGIYELPLAPSESQFLAQCRALVFGLLLAMEARPALLSRGRKVGSHKKSRREMWEPNVVGRDYRIVRERGPATGTHTSPRMHWRRGHWRQQPFGAGRSQIRRIWIEPALVGS